MMRKSTYPYSYRERKREGKWFVNVSENVREDVYDRLLMLVSSYGNSKLATQLFFDTQLRRESKRDQAASQRDIPADLHLPPPIDSKMCNSVILACAWEGNLKCANEMLSTMNIHDQRPNAAAADRLINGVTYAYMSGTYRSCVFAGANALQAGLYSPYEGGFLAQLVRYTNEVDFYEHCARNSPASKYESMSVDSALQAFEMRFPREFWDGVIGFYAAAAESVGAAGSEH